MDQEDATNAYVVMRGVDLKDEAQVMRWRLQGLPIVQRWIRGDLTLMHLKGPTDGEWGFDSEDRNHQIVTWYSPIDASDGAWRAIFVEVLELGHDDIDSCDRLDWVAVHGWHWATASGGSGIGLLGAFDFEARYVVTLDRS